MLQRNKQQSRGGCLKVELAGLQSLVGERVVEGIGVAGSVSGGSEHRRRTKYGRNLCRSGSSDRWCGRVSNTVGALPVLSIAVYVQK